MVSPVSLLLSPEAMYNYVVWKMEECGRMSGEGILPD